MKFLRNNLIKDKKEDKKVIFFVMFFELNLLKNATEIQGVHFFFSKLGTSFQQIFLRLQVFIKTFLDLYMGVHVLNYMLSSHNLYV